MRQAVYGLVSEGRRGERAASGASSAPRSQGSLDSVGTTIAIRLVRPGNAPAAYEAAHGELSDYIRRLGHDPEAVLADFLRVYSVKLVGGQGTCLEVTYEEERMKEE